MVVDGCCESRDEYVVDVTVVPFMYYVCHMHHTGIVRKGKERMHRG